MTEPILNINNVSIEYKKYDPIVKSLSMVVNSKEIVGIVGESGSGKSTLIRAILGLLSDGGTVTDGEIIFKGKNLLECSKKEWRDIRGNKIAMIFQDSGNFLNPTRKIGSQFIESIQCHMQISKSDAYDKAINMFRKMQLPDGNHIMSSYPFQLSGGMNQRVAIAMAMVMEPELLLADEPTSALDVTIQAQVVRHMMDLRNNFNTSIIIVTHNMGVAAYMCDKIGVMKQGELVEWGSKHQVINNPKNDYTLNLLSSVPELGGNFIDKK